jgi:hypothetical protein
MMTMLRSKACFLSPFVNHLAYICIALLFGNIYFEISNESEVLQRLFHPTISSSSSMMMMMDSFIAVEATTNANDLVTMYALRSAFNNYTGWAGADPCAQTGGKKITHLS